MFRRLLTAAAFLAPLYVALAQHAQASDEVHIVPSPAGSGPEDTTYEIRAGSCRIRWTVARFGADRGIAQHRAECTLPLSEQIALNAALLDKVLESEPTFRMLFLGRLKPFPEISIRLADAAKHSSEWDSRQGKPKNSMAMDRYLGNLLASNESSVFAEWKRLFEEKRLTFTVAGVESVTVGAAGTLPYFPQLAARGAMASDKLPFDCLIWFSATRQQ
jgi:hypothetical protein